MTAETVFKSSGRPSSFKFLDGGNHALDKIGVFHDFFVYGKLVGQLFCRRRHENHASSVVYAFGAHAAVGFENNVAQS